MAKYQVTEEWTNYRIWEIEADSEHHATELVMNGHGEQVSDQIEGYEADAIQIVNGKAVTTTKEGN